MTTLDLWDCEGLGAGEGADQGHPALGGDRLASAEVGVPTGPISAKTLSSSSSFLVASIDLVGS